MQISISKMSAGLRDLLNTTPEHRSRYQWALNLVETCSVRELRDPGAPLAREYSSWNNARSRKGLDPSISTFKSFIKIHGPMPDDGEWSLDRINPRGPYSPPNIRWLNALGQTRNRTNTLRLPYHGNELPLQTVAHILGESYRTIHKTFSKNPDQLIEKLDSVSPSLQYQFPAPFSEDLEAEYATDVRELIKLRWIIDFTTQEVLQLREELADDPHNPQLHEQHDNASNVMRHALAFREWAKNQTAARIRHHQSILKAGPLPPWERDAMQFQPSPPPLFEQFDN